MNERWQRAALDLLALLPADRYVLLRPSTKALLDEASPRARPVTEVDVLAEIDAINQSLSRIERGYRVLARAKRATTQQGGRNQ